MHSNSAARLQSVATGCQPSISQFTSQFIASLQSWWQAFLDWRIERAAILQLEALSDRELRDIGLRRCEIEGAVKFWPERRPALRPPGRKTELRRAA
jgi:uncharacterized protein YjiS (DUF1127 family)